MNHFGQGEVGSPDPQFWPLNCCISVKPVFGTHGLKHGFLTNRFDHAISSIVSSFRRIHPIDRIHMVIHRFVLGLGIALTCFGWGLPSDVHAEPERASVATLPQVVADTTERHTQARRLFVRGMTEAFLEDYDTAIGYFEQSLKLHPGQSAVLSALSDAHASQNDLTSALFYARQAYIRTPETPHYALRLAGLQRRDSHIQAAIETYHTLLDAHPQHLAARKALAETHTEVGNLEAAASTYETVLEQSNEPLPDVRQIGRAHV